MKTVMLVFGTRPEAIKMCPLVNELKSRENIRTVVCVTGQHRQMLDMVLDTFNVVPDYDLSIMKAGQTLFDITTNILNRIGDVLEKVKDEVYRGCKLLTHPLSGSVKPNETPYKSVMVSVSAGKADLMGIEIIERAIASCGKFEFKSDQYAPQVYEDFRLIDYTLISSALPSADAW